MLRYLAFPLLLLVSGCGTQVLIQGEPNFNTAILLPYPATEQLAVSSRNAGNLGLVPAALPGECQSAPSPQAPSPTAAVGAPTPFAPTSATVPQAQVAACLYAVKAIIDDLYREYRITLHHAADDGNAWAEMTVLGLTTAATGPVGLVAKTALSGVSTFVGGSKSILNQDLLYQKAIEDVINQMDIDRDTQFNTMLGQMKGNYSIEQAKADLLEYFSAGTWDHAIVSLQTTIAAKKNDCKNQTDANKVNAAATSATAPATPGSPAPGAAAPAAPLTTGTPPPASATTNNCGPATPTPTALTPDIAKAGKIFQTTAQTFFKVTTAAKTPTDKITVEYSTDISNFSSKNSETLVFSDFARLVTPTPWN